MHVCLPCFRKNRFKAHVEAFGGSEKRLCFLIKALRGISFKGGEIIDSAHAVDGYLWHTDGSHAAA